MKKILLTYILIVLSTLLTAQIAIPTGVSVIVLCGTNNYDATFISETGSGGLEWVSDYLGRDLIEKSISEASEIKKINSSKLTSDGVCFVTIYDHNNSIIHYKN